MKRAAAALVLALLHGAAASAPAQDAGPIGTPEPPVDALPSGPSVEVRLEEIRRRIQAALVYPHSARRQGFEGVTWVRFEIDRAGAAQDIELARSSGHALLDRAARRSVARAGTLPWVYGRIEVPVRFSLEYGRVRRPPPGGAG